MIHPFCVLHIVVSDSQNKPLWLLKKLFASRLGLLFELNTQTPDSRLRAQLVGATRKHTSMPNRVGTPSASRRRRTRGAKRMDDVGSEKHLRMSSTRTPSTRGEGFPGLFK